MASLTNTKIKDTYDGLLKTTDNDALGGTYKLITDGLGNSSNVYLGTGGSVGIGASSPQSYYSGADNLVVSQSSGEGGITIATANNTNGALYFADGISGSEQYRGGIGYNHSNDELFIVSGGSTKATIDSSGNVGIGTSTLNTISGSNPTLTLAGTGITGGLILQNSGTDTARIYETGGLFIHQGMSGIGHSFYVNASTEAMHIDTSGRLGLGTSSPSTKLHLSDTSDSIIRIQRVGVQELQLNSDGTVTAASTDLKLVSTGNISFTASGSERIKLDSSGRLGLGTSNPDSKFHIGLSNGSQLRFDYQGSGDNYYDGATHYFRNTNGNSNIMTLLDGGNVGIGTSSPSSKAHIKGALRLEDSTDSTTREHILNVESSGALSFTDSISGERMRIDYDGSVFMYAISGAASGLYDVQWTSSAELVVITSSARYKENINDLPSVLDKVNALRPVSFTEISSQTETVGLIAEEVVEVIPEIVAMKEIEGYDDPQPDGVNYSRLPTYLIKAIQEQQEIINELKAEIETLKSQINS